MAGNGAPSASDAALADLLGAQQQQLAHLSQQITQFQVQNRQQTTHIRQIPLIPKLSRAEDLQTWRGMLVMVLYDFNLLEYLVGPDIPEPKDPAARRSWLIDRLDLTSTSKPRFLIPKSGIPCERLVGLPRIRTPRKRSISSSDISREVP